MRSTLKSGRREATDSCCGESSALLVDLAGHFESYRVLSVFCIAVEQIHRVLRRSPLAHA
jgi:hypothetical protein